MTIVMTFSKNVNFKIGMDHCNDRKYCRIYYADRIKVIERENMFAKLGNVSLPFSEKSTQLMFQLRSSVDKQSLRLCLLSLCKFKRYLPPFQSLLLVYGK